MKINYTAEYQKGNLLLFIFNLLNFIALILWLINILFELFSYPKSANPENVILKLLLGFLAYSFLLLIFKTIKAAFIARDIQIETFMEKQAQKWRSDQASKAEFLNGR